MRGREGISELTGKKGSCNLDEVTRGRRRKLEPRAFYSEVWTDCRLPTQAQLPALYQTFRMMFPDVLFLKTKSLTASTQPDATEDLSAIPAPHSLLQVSDDSLVDPWHLVPGALKFRGGDWVWLLLTPESKVNTRIMVPRSRSRFVLLKVLGVQNPEPLLCSRL